MKGFCFQYQFFYQLQINYYVLLFKDLLIYSIIGCLIFNLIINPCFIKVGFSKTFKRYIKKYFLKKKYDFFEFNVKIRRQNKKFKKKEQENELEHHDLTPIHIDEVYSYHFQYDQGVDEIYFNLKDSNFLFKFILDIKSCFYSNIGNAWRGIP